MKNCAEKPHDNEFVYIGDELTVFKAAINWKSYYAKKIKKYITGNVLEVGAGLGGTTNNLHHAGVTSWTCLEPDGLQLVECRKNTQELSENHSFEYIAGILEDQNQEQKFDTIIYIDVLEHIEFDGKELTMAKNFLNSGGRIIVLSPAHNHLFSPFDKAVGHFRRYNKQSLNSLCPKDLIIEKSFYLDSLGMLASLANRLLLKESMPNQKQILFWDRMIIPFSKILDVFLFYKLGKTIITVFRKEGI